MAACIAKADPKWGERPLLVVVRQPGATLTKDDVLRLFDGKVAKWALPDDVVFAESIPIGPTGKMQKNKLRAAYGDPIVTGGRS
jgi:fatty-acyl-CoA synthase